MKDILESFNGLKVLVVGDVMIDAYCFGRVDRISPEAPVPVVAVEKEENRLGGAANVAMNLVSLGAKPIVCSVVGEDKGGDEMIQLFQENGVGISGIVKSKDRRTTVKTRVIAQQTQMLRIDSEMTQPITKTESYELLEKIKELLRDADVLIFEDYDKGVLHPDLISEVTAAAKALKVPVVVDPKKRNFNAYKEVDLFKPNLKELRDGLHADIDPEDKFEFEESIRNFMKTMNQKSVMITLSERGVLITDGKTFDYVPAHYRKITDVSGAGDTVISVAALCLALGMDQQKIAELSNLAGGLVCEEVGVVPIDKQKFKTELLRLSLL